MQLGLRDLGRGVGAARRARHADQVRERRRHRAQLVEVVGAEAARAASPSFAETVSTSSLLRMPGGALEDLDDRPVRDALAVGEAAAPEHVARPRAARCAISATRRLLPMPGSPMIVASAGRRRPARAPRARAGARARRRGRRAARRARVRARSPRAHAESPARRAPAPPCPSRSIGSCSAYSIACARRAVGHLADEDARRRAPPTRCARRC